MSKGPLLGCYATTPPQILTWLYPWIVILFVIVITSARPNETATLTLCPTSVYLHGTHMEPIIYGTHVTIGPMGHICSPFGLHLMHDHGNAIHRHPHSSVRWGN